MSANFAELVNQGVSRQDCPVVNNDMTRQRRIVHKNRMVLNNTVVTDMHVAHDEVVVSHVSIASVLHGTSVNRHVLAYDVVVTNRDGRRLALILQVRCGLANGAKLEDVVPSTNLGRPLDHHMGFDNRPLANHNPRTDDTVGTHRHGGVQISLRVNNGGGMNHRLAVRAQDSGCSCRFTLDRCTNIKLPDASFLAHNRGLQSDSVTGNAGSLEP